jgi:hypothetical protein
MKRIIASLVLLFALSPATRADLTTSLVSYWKLDEASGNAVDVHGSNNLTDTNTVGAGTGKINGARDFELDSSEYFTIADNAALSGSDRDIAMTAWVNMETKAAAMRIVSKYGSSGSREYALLYNSVSDRFEFQVSSNGTGSTANVSANNLGSPSTGTWYYVIAWHDATNDLIGIQVNNGTANTTAATGGIFDSTTPFGIGAVASSGGSPFDGLIDEVGFWDRLLTADEKTSLYNSGNGLAYPFSVGVAIDPLSSTIPGRARDPLGR